MRDLVKSPELYPINTKGKRDGRGFCYADEVNSQFISIADILSDIRGGVGILQSFAAGARLILIIRLTADHGGVIAAQLQRRHKQLDVLALCHVLQGRPQEGIGCHAACTHNAPRMRLLDGEIMGIGLIDIDAKDCMMLKAHQSLSNKELSLRNKTMVDFYIGVIKSNIYC